jgi:hypothetical protein
MQGDLDVRPLDVRVLLMSGNDMLGNTMFVRVNVRVLMLVLNVRVTLMLGDGILGLHGC